MNGNTLRMALPPFPPEYRASGILLHVASLPSRYGIGDLGPAALAWIGRLREAGQSWWQALPLGPTGYANSPYQSSPRGSSGAIPSMTGTRFAAPGTAGVSIVCAHFCIM